MRNQLIRLLLVVTVVVATGAPASAERTRAAKADQSSDGTTTVSVGLDGSVPRSSSGGGSGISCSYYDTTVGDTDAIEFTPHSGEYVEGHYYWIECFDADGGSLFARYFEYRAGTPPVSPFRLALAASATLALGHPEPRTNPDRSVAQLVGIDTWLWIDEGSWEPLTATATIPGLSATVTATPVRTTWDMGDGAPPVVCDGPGTPYDTSRPEAGQRTDCSHLYQVRGSYTATATITWRTTWSATNGESGTLASAGRSTRFPMAVAERQAVGA
jgi:hypothetical protein